jgi:hypothetical protein
VSCTVHTGGGGAPAPGLAGLSAPVAAAGIVDLTADDDDDDSDSVVVLSDGGGERKRPREEPLREGAAPSGAARHPGKRAKVDSERPGSGAAPRAAARAPDDKLFVDLDGVLADFDGGVLRVTGRLPHQQSAQDMWRRLAAAKPPFFEGLDWTADCGEKLWAAIAPFSPAVLTGLPRGAWAEPQKRRWCARFLGASVKVHCCPSKDKKNYAASCLRLEKRRPVLIDDRQQNCEEWQRAGGTAVLHTCLDSTLRQLRELGYSLGKSARPGAQPASDGGGSASVD